MNIFLALVLALTINTDPPRHTNLYHGAGQLSSMHQITLQLFLHASPSLPIKVEVKGDGHGDIDCYVLRPNHSNHSWVIAAKDESNLDGCSISYIHNDDEQIRVWFVNHGQHTTDYTVDVDQ